MARQAPLSLGCSRPEYWRGLPFPSPGNLLNPGTEPAAPESPALAGGFSTAATWEAKVQRYNPTNDGEWRWGERWVEQSPPENI